MKRKNKHEDEPLEMAVVEDFLPPPDQLALKQDTVKVTIGEDIKKRPNLRYFVSVVLSREDGHLIARRAGQQGSGALRAMTRAHGLLVLPEDVDNVAAGDEGMVQVMYPDDVPL